jgi:SAM-dependent MidA family methyltransferase
MEYHHAQAKRPPSRILAPGQHTMSEIQTSLSGTGNPSLVALLRERILADGAITFAEFMATALYHDEHGYYRQPHRKPGRGGDFITSPELHPFFGFTLARQVADFWDRLGQPERLVVREHGASSGGLAYDIMVGLAEKAPDVLDALDYRLVDVSTHRLDEAISAMSGTAMAAHVRAEHPDDVTPETGIVLANEVADALPIHRLVVRGDRLREMWVTLDVNGVFTPEERELSTEVVDAGIPAYLAGAGVEIGRMPDGSELDVSPAAARWIMEIAGNLTQGFAVVIDYGYDALTLYREHRLEGTVRGYHQHTVTDDPYIRVGEQDLTAHVDFTWLSRTAREAGMREIGLTTQGEFLTHLGMGEWLVEMQHQPETDLAEYYRAQAAVFRLIDPSGLGRFRVLGLAKGMGEAPSALGWQRLDVAHELRTLTFG